MITHAIDNGIHILNLCNDPNLLDPRSVQELQAKLDEVQESGARVNGLVLTAEGNFFCNGLNIAALEQMNVKNTQAFARQLAELYCRLLSFPVPTVCAMNGHAFGTGAYLALACDYRIMREDRGWFCFFDADSGVPVNTALIDLARAKLSPDTLRDAILARTRYRAEQAVQAGIAHCAQPQPQLVAAAVELAASLKPEDQDSYLALKQAVWGPLTKKFSLDLRVPRPDLAAAIVPPRRTSLLDLQPTASSGSVANKIAKAQGKSVA